MLAHRYTYTYIDYIYLLCASIHVYTCTYHNRCIVCMIPSVKDRLNIKGWRKLFHEAKR